MVVEFAGSPARYAWLFELLSTPAAFRGYAVAAGAVALVISLSIAIAANRSLANQFDITSRQLRAARKGKPSTPEGWRRRGDKVRGIIGDGIRASAKSMLSSLMFGVVVPATALLVATLYYGWFDPRADHLLASGAPENQIGMADAAMFVLDQTLRGGLFDLLEVFALQTTHIDNNPAAWPYSTGIFLYHLYVEAFVFSGILLFIRSAWGLRKAAETQMEDIANAQATIRPQTEAAH